MLATSAEVLAGAPSGIGTRVTLDGNEAAAHVAYQLSDVAPASPLRGISGGHGR